MILIMKIWHCNNINVLLCEESHFPDRLVLHKFTEFVNINDEFARCVQWSLYLMNWLLMKLFNALVYMLSFVVHCYFRVKELNCFINKCTFWMILSSFRLFFRKGVTLCLSERNMIWSLMFGIGRAVVEECLLERLLLWWVSVSIQIYM